MLRKTLLGMLCLAFYYLCKTIVEGKYVLEDKKLCTLRNGRRCRGRLAEISASS